MNTFRLLAVMVCCAVSGTVLGQHDKPGDQEKKDPMPAMSEMQRAMLEAGTPGKMHEWIARSAGTWDCTLKMMMPDQPVQESKGTMTTKMIFGGRYAHSMFTCDFMGMPFEGTGTLGYNNTTGRFECTWADNVSTATTFMTGTLDASGKVLTLTGECTDPMTRKPCTMRQVTTLRGDDEMVEEFYKTIDGKETKVVETTYRRAKGAAMEKSAVDRAKADAEKMKKQAEDAIRKAMPGDRK